MNSELENKLLLLRANKFSHNIQGASSFTIFPVLDNELAWHRKTFTDIIKTENSLKGMRINHPLFFEDLISILTVIIEKSEDDFNCCIIFEDLIKIQFCVKNFRNFISSIFDIYKTYDLFLNFKNPDRVLVINDEENWVDIYFISRDT